MQLGKLGVWYFFDSLSSQAAAEAAKRIAEALRASGVRPAREA